MMADQVESRVPLLGLVHQPSVYTSAAISWKDTIKTEKKDKVMRRTSHESEIISLISDDDEDSNNNTKIHQLTNLNVNVFNQLSSSSSMSAENNLLICSMEVEKTGTKLPDSNKIIMIFDDDSEDECEQNTSTGYHNLTKPTVSDNRIKGVNSHIDFSIFNVQLSDDEDEQDNGGNEFEYEDISEASDLEIDEENQENSYNFNSLCRFSPKKSAQHVVTDNTDSNLVKDRKPVLNNSNSDQSESNIVSNTTENVATDDQLVFNNSGSDQTSADHVSDSKIYSDKFSMNNNANECFNGFIPSIAQSGLRDSPEPRATVEISASSITSHKVIGGDLNTSGDSVKSCYPDLTESQRDAIHVLSHEQATRDLDQELTSLLDIGIGEFANQSSPDVSQTESDKSTQKENGSRNEDQVKRVTSPEAPQVIDNRVMTPPVKHHRLPSFDDSCDTNNTPIDLNHTVKNNPKAYQEHKDMQRKLAQIDFCKEKIKVGLEILKLSKTTIISQCKCPKNQQYIANIDFLCKYYQETPANIKQYYRNKFHIFMHNPKLSQEEKEELNRKCQLEIVSKFYFMLNHFSATMDIMLKQVKNSCSYCESSSGGSVNSVQGSVMSTSPPPPAYSMHTVVVDPTPQSNTFVHGNAGPTLFRVGQAGPLINTASQINNVNSSNQGQTQEYNNNSLQRRPLHIRPSTVPCNTVPHNTNNGQMDNASNNQINNMGVNNTNNTQIAQACSRLQKESIDNFETRMPTLPQFTASNNAFQQTSISQVSPTNFHNQTPYTHVGPQQSHFSNGLDSNMSQQGQMPHMGQGQYMHSSLRMASNNNNNGMSFMHSKSQYQQSQIHQQRPNHQPITLQAQNQHSYNHDYLTQGRWYPQQPGQQWSNVNSACANRKRKASHTIRQQQAKFTRLNNNVQC